MIAICQACKEIVTGPRASATTPDGLSIIGNPEAEAAVEVAEIQGLQIEMTKHLQLRHPAILKSIMQMAQQFGYAVLSKAFVPPDLSEDSFNRAVDGQLTMLYWTLKGSLKVTSGPHLPQKPQNGANRVF